MSAIEKFLAESAAWRETIEDDSPVNRHANQLIYGEWLRDNHDRYERLVRELMAEVEALSKGVERAFTDDVFLALLRDEKHGLAAVEERWAK